MTDDRTFPVLWQGSREYKEALAALDCPRVVPWAFIEEHHAACLRNHDQTPQRLAERGGLGPEEILAVIDDKPQKWAQRTAFWNLPPERSVPALKAALETWNLRQIRSEQRRT